MPDDRPAKVTLGHLARAEQMCSRRLQKEHTNNLANWNANRRFRLANQVTEEVRLVHADLAAPRLERFGAGTGLTPEQGHVYDLAIRWYVTLFTAPARVVDEDPWGTDIADGMRLVGPGGIPFTDADDAPEIRILSLGGRPAPSAPLVDHPAVRFAILRRTEWLAGRPVHVAIADLVHGTYDDATIDTAAVLPVLDDWLAERIEVIRARVAHPTPTVGLECAWCPYIAGCPPHRA
jgi:hypothetical protein